MANARRNGGSEKSRARRNDTPLLEWILGVAGVLLVLAALAFLVYEGVNNEDAPGDVVVSIAEIIETRGAYLVRFRMHNSGSQTLANLHVSARLSDGDAEIEVAQALIDYLPGRSSSEAGVYLRHDPRRYTLEIRPEGFQTP